MAGKAEPSGGSFGLARIDVDMAASPERPGSPQIRSAASSEPMQTTESGRASAPNAPISPKVLAARVLAATASLPANDTGVRVHSNTPTHRSDLQSTLAPHSEGAEAAIGLARNFRPAGLPPLHVGGVESRLEPGWSYVPRQWELSDFQPIEKLYRGYASKVYLAKDNGKLKIRGPNGAEKTLPGTGQLVVLKVYDLLRLSPLTMYQLNREVRLHSAVNHDNIVNLIASFTQSDFRILVQSYAHGGDLYNYLRKQRVRLTEKKLVRMVLQPCLSALAYLHSQNIVHRDIKPENLLLDSEMVIKLADFGLSINTTEENAVTRAGTLDYMAPEVLVCPLKRLPTDYKDTPNLAYSNKVDSWSMGVLAFELLTGHSPYQQRDEKALLNAITTTAINFPASMSNLAIDWVTAALDKEAGSRASVHDLLTHPWVMVHSRRSSSLATSHSPAFSLTSADDTRECHTPNAYGQSHIALASHHNDACHGEDPKNKKSSLSPAVMSITLQDGSNTPSGCRSPAALHMTPDGSGALSSLSSSLSHLGPSSRLASPMPSSPLSRNASRSVADAEVPIPASRLRPPQTSNPDA